MSKSFIESGLSLWLADKVSIFSGLPLPILQLFSVLVSAFLTTFTLNTGACNIVTPFIAEIVSKEDFNNRLQQKTIFFERRKITKMEERIAIGL